MLRDNKKTLILTSIIILLPAVIGLILWNKLPDNMATHFGINNLPDGFSSKIFSVAVLPLIFLALQLVSVVLTANDPKKKNISNKLFVLILWIIPCVSTICFTILYLYNMGIKMNVSLFGDIIIGLLFIIIGNYLPKIRQNYTIGIKLPWTLANEENWNKTHRLAGILWIIAGIVLIFTTFISNVSNICLVLPVILVSVLVPAIYSFILHTVKGL